MSTEPAVQISRPLNETVETTFSFREDKLGNKRPAIKLSYFVPTIDGLIEQLGDEKISKYVLSLISDDIKGAVRGQINSEDKPVNTQEELDMSKLTLTALANISRAERLIGGVTKETWEGWSEDYVSVMPAVTGKKLENVQNAATIFLKQLRPVKTQKQILKVLKEQLALWAGHTKELESYADIYQFLDGKIDAYLATDEAALLENL